MENFNIKPAIQSDLPFIIDCIIGAEYSGSNILSYCEIFNITEANFRKMLLDIFEEEIDNQPWNLKHWFVGTINEERVVGGCCWIEGESGQGSDMLKSQILQYFLPQQWQNNLEKLSIISEITIPRVQGAVQVEYFYTHPLHRKKGLITSMIYFIDETFPDRDKEIIMVGNNIAAMELYKRHGYNVREIKKSTDKNILTLLPSDTKVALLKNHEHRIH